MSKKLQKNGVYDIIQFVDIEWGEKFNNAQIFRSYKMPDDHKKPSQQEQHVNIRNMHLRRFPQLQLERGPNTLKMS